MPAKARDKCPRADDYSPNGAPLSKGKGKSGHPGLLFWEQICYAVNIATSETWLACLE
jgi:hypothetical protein